MEFLASVRLLSLGDTATLLVESDIDYDKLEKQIIAELCKIESYGEKCFAFYYNGACIHVTRVDPVEALKNMPTNGGIH